MENEFYRKPEIVLVYATIMHLLEMFSGLFYRDKVCAEDKRLTDVFEQLLKVPISRKNMFKFLALFAYKDRANDLEYSMYEIFCDKMIKDLFNRFFKVCKDEKLSKHQKKIEYESEYLFLVKARVLNLDLFCNVGFRFIICKRRINTYLNFLNCLCIEKHDPNYETNDDYKKKTALCMLHDSSFIYPSLLPECEFKSGYYATDSDYEDDKYIVHGCVEYIIESKSMMYETEFWRID